jgi:outer membrane protein assembly factor BamB
MWPLTHHSFILTILLLTPMGYIGSAGGQTTLLGPSLESELMAEGSTTNGTTPVYEYKDNWALINHDLYGTRSSNQTSIVKDNVDKLQLKWRWLNEYEIQDPPIIKEGKGYAQDYAGNIIAFDTRTGHTIWNVDVGGGPSMGLAYDSGIIFASTATNATIIAINSSDGKKLWESELLGDPKVGYSIDASPIVWGDYVIAGSGGSGLPPGSGLVKGNVTALNRTSGEIIWNLETTTGEWVEQGKTLLMAGQRHDQVVLWIQTRAFCIYHWEALHQTLMQVQGKRQIYIQIIWLQ